MPGEPTRASQPSLAPREAGRLGRVLASKEFKTLITVARVARKGAFTFALYDNDLNRAALVDEIRGRVAPQPVFEWTISRQEPNVRDFLLRLTTDELAERAVVCIYEIETAFPESARWIDLMREALAAQPHTLIVWIKAETWGEIATLAPNFFSRHSGVFDLRLPIEPGERDTALSRPTYTHELVYSNPDDRRRSLALFEHLLADAEVDPETAPGLLADLHLRIGKLKYANLEYPVALRDFQQALELYGPEASPARQAEIYEEMGNAYLFSSDHAAARARYEEARSLYERVGSVLGQANCIKSLGDIALERSDHDAARARYEEALRFYQKISYRYGIDGCHHRLARITSTNDERNQDEWAARAALTQIHLDDLVQKLRDEFGDMD